jgi:hypothetical protein
MPVPNASVYENLESLPALISANNIPTDGLFGIMIWAIAYIVIFTVFMSSRYGSYNADKEAFLASSIVMVPITSIMVLPGIALVDVWLSVIPIILSVVGVMVVYRTNTPA